MRKAKYICHIKSKDFYDHYARLYFKEKIGNKGVKIHTESKFYMSKTLHTNILRDINLGLMDLILNEPLDCILPARLGIVCVRKRKPELRVDDISGEVINKMPINWKETRALWKEDPQAKENKKFIRHFNNHSNQYVSSFVWKNRHCNFTNKTAYSFIACRTAKENLAEIMLDEDRTVDYFLKETR